MTHTLTLSAAAELLHVHPHTLEAWARDGHVPAAKPGRRWVFIEADLLDWLRNWRDRKKEEESICRSTDVARPGGASGASAARELERALAQTTGKRRRNITTAAVLRFGERRA